MGILPQEVLERFDRSESTVYVFDSNYVVRYVNKHYVDFADQNHGGDICLRWGVNSSVFDPIPVPLQPFYRDFYDKAFQTKSVTHEYECSSPTEFRRFRLTTYLWPDENVVVAEHALIEQSGIESVYVIHEFNELDHCKMGLITKCCHCNKVYNNNAEAWEFVPELLENSVENISHGYCPVCSDYYIHEAKRVAASLSSM